MGERKVKVITKLFGNNKIKYYWNDNVYDNYFDIIDVIEALTNSKKPKEYWENLNRKLKRENDKILKYIVKMPNPNNKSKTVCAINFTGIIRLIMLVKSKKAEHYKSWLIDLSYDRIDEIFDPEMAIDRAINLYRKKGYSYRAIDSKIKFIYDRNRLFNTRGYKENKNCEYKILFNEIYNSYH